MFLGYKFVCVEELFDREGDLGKERGILLLQEEDLRFRGFACVCVHVSVCVSMCKEKKSIFHCSVPTLYCLGIINGT